MDASITTAIITSSSAIIIAALTFYLTKRSEREAEWRQKKLDHYRQLLSSISDLATDGDQHEAANRFASTVNTIALVAPQKVIAALMNFQDEITIANKNKTQEAHDRLLLELILSIRKDIALTTKDDKKTFSLRLVGSLPKRQ